MKFKDTFGNILEPVIWNQRVLVVCRHKNGDETTQSFGADDLRVLAEELTAEGVKEDEV